MQGLQEPLLGKGELLTPANNDMIEYPDVQQAERRAKAFGNTSVSCTGLGKPGWVIMGKNNRCSPVLQRPGGNFPGIYCCPVKGSEKQVFTTQHPMLGVQKNAAEHLPCVSSQMMLQKPQQ